MTLSEIFDREIGPLVAFEIQYKQTPQSRRIMTAIQFHPNKESASKLVLIRDHDPEAVCVGVREISDPRSAFREPANTR